MVLGKLRVVEVEEVGDVVAFHIQIAIGVGGVLQEKCANES